MLYLPSPHTEHTCAPTRLLRLIHLTAAQNQQDEATIDRLTALESEVRGRYTNFRGRVDGAELSDTALDDILDKSADSDEVRQGGEARKKDGGEVADQV